MKANKVLKRFFESDGISILDGCKTKLSAKKLIYKLTDQYLHGSFTDIYWRPVNEIFKIFQSNNIDYVIDETKYDTNIPSTSKTWYLTIRYKDNNNKEQKLITQLKAHGGGSIQDPLDRYDLTLIMN